ncbi:hypothetical protein M758_6G071600 [Ceratodon purpureus]|uniref:Uncharacterized protein n=1 Tax=Ceratodon purpureus TaxID=3225 RepID=A0A8T0HFH6_CERPU|nr:hypothetical protein KC19_6G076200 [Ceratodon purpureus]KAG0613037.1 hypothetical protein M758_6G071600 [Ceratodon purpureus]
MKAGGMSSIGAMAMAMALMLAMTNLQVSNAQGSCLTVAGAGAPFSDATTVVQQLRVKPGQCCQSSSGFCTVQLTSGNAAATVCGPTGFCPNCADVGNGLNIILAQCNVNGEVQGAYSPIGSSQQLFYLTSASNHP